MYACGSVKPGDTVDGERQARLARLRRQPGDLLLSAQSPGGWRATNPAVLRGWLVQRVPPPDSALVS